MKKFTFEPSYDIDKFDEEKPKEIEYHFFGSSAFEWKTNVDFQEVYDWFVKQGNSFSIYFIPSHARKGYYIENRIPQADDAHWLGTYHPK
jgi:hypothetical protein